MNQIEDVFNTEEFKALPFKKRVWMRLKIAFFQTIQMM